MTSISNMTGSDRFGAQQSYISERHWSAARVMAYALTLAEFDYLSAASAIWAVRLTDHERAALSFVALKSLDQVQALLVVEAAFSESDTPLPPLLSSADEAAHWATRAEYVDIMSYTLAGFNRLTARDKSAFLDYVQRRAA